MSAAPAIPLQTYDVGPGAPSIPFAGGETFGGWRARPGPTHSGAATLVPISDAAAAALEPGEVVLVETADRAIVPLHVARIRTAIAGDLGTEYEVLVVDARSLDGRCLTYNPNDLLDAEVSS